MNQRTLFLIIFLGFLTLGLVSFAIFSEKEKQEAPLPTPGPMQTASITPVPASAVLSLQISTPKAENTSKTGVDVWLDSGINSISAIQLEIQYDPNVLSNVAIEQYIGPDSFFGSIQTVSLIDQINPQLGRISYALGISFGVKAPVGKGKIATISFNKRAGSPATTITFLPSSQVTQPKARNSILKESIPLTVN